MPICQIGKDWRQSLSLAGHLQRKGVACLISSKIDAIFVRRWAAASKAVSWSTVAGRRPTDVLGRGRGLRSSQGGRVP